MESFPSVFACFVAWWSAGLVFHVALYVLGVTVSARQADELMKS